MREDYMNRLGSLAGSIMPEPKRLSQVEEQLNHVRNQLGIQRDAIDRLTSKMQPVLSLSGPEPETRKEPNGPTCPLANDLLALAGVVSAHTQIIESLIRRLEV